MPIAMGEHVYVHAYVHVTCAGGKAMHRCEAQQRNKKYIVVNIHICGMAKILTSRIPARGS